MGKTKFIISESVYSGFKKAKNGNYVTTINCVIAISTGSIHLLTKEKVVKFTVSKSIYSGFKETKSGTFVIETDCNITIGIAGIRACTDEDKKRTDKKRKRKWAKRNTMINAYFDEAEILANMYAREFLGKRSYNLTKKSPSILKFIDAVKKVDELATKHIKDIPNKRLYEWLISSLRVAYKEQGKTIHPGHLCSDYTWDNVLPQYVESQLGIPFDDDWTSMGGGGEDKELERRLDAKRKKEKKEDEKPKRRRKALEDWEDSDVPRER